MPLNKNSVTIIKRFLRKRCCTGSGFELLGMDKAKEQLNDLIWRSINHDESNSVLLVGPRGSGKSQLVETVLRQVETTSGTNYIKIYLNGLLQRDEGSALKEIIRQLKLKQEDLKSFTSTHENLQYVLDLISKEQIKSKDGEGGGCILLVIDEFDLFLRQKNQGLLYNLFDVVQSFKTATCVIGLTTRLDVLELFEKRVKSRFSQRIIHTFEQEHHFTAYHLKALHFLSLPAEVSGVSVSAVEEWNANVKRLMDEHVMVDILKKQHCLDKDPRLILSFLLYPISKLSLEPPFHLDPAHFVKSYQLLHATDSRVALMQGMSVLELSLMVCMHRLDEVYPGEPVNFEMLYLEYSNFIGRKFSNMTTEKSIILKAFENLCYLELIRPSAEGSSEHKSSKEHRLMESMVGLTQLKQVIRHFHNCPTNIRQWIDQAT